MLASPHRHLWQGVKCLKSKSPKSILCQNSHGRHVSLLFVIQYSHTTAARSSTINVNFSRVRNHFSRWIKHKWEAYHPISVVSHSRGIVTSASDANVDQDTVTMKDNNKKSFNAAVSNPKDDDDEATDGKDGCKVDNHRKRIANHIPVMVEELLEALQPKNGQTIVDMTFGAGGHAQEILKAAPGIHYFASDRDPLANNIALKLAAENGQGRITPILSRFSEVPILLHQHGIEPGTVDAFFFDLGASSMQFDIPERGFSLSRDGPLDMRMDGDRFPDSPTAADVVNSLSPHDLAHIFKKYGEEKKSLQIAHAIVEARYAFGNFTRTKQLADVILSVFNSGAFRLDKLTHHAHVATKCFQALRIFVNNELNELHNGLEVAKHYLRPHGRCAVISFHSLEDRIVKRHFLDIDIDEASNKSIHDYLRNADVSFDIKTLQEEYMTKPWEPLSRKVKEPTQDECWKNPRARSAKLRAALKA